MATEIRYPDPVSKSENRLYSFDFTNDLPFAITIANATATHTPPSGAPFTPSVQFSGAIVGVLLGPLSVTGIHYLDVLATLSDDEISAIRMIITVMW